jgi:hypothetical protein
VSAALGLTSGACGNESSTASADPAANENANVNTAARTCTPNQRLIMLAVPLVRARATSTSRLTANLGCDFKLSQSKLDLRVSISAGFDHMPAMRALDACDALFSAKAA